MNSDDAPFDFDAFARDYYARLLARAKQLVGLRGGEPRDVVQEVYARLARRTTPPRTMGDALAFCLINLSFVATDNARRRRSVPVAEFPEDAAGVSPDPADSVAGRSTLELARGLLTTEQREVWERIDIQGKTPQEVQTELRITITTVRNRLWRARETLRASRELFRAVVASALILPTRRRVAASGRPEPAWLAATSVFAGLAMLAAPPAAVPPEAQTRPPLTTRGPLADATRRTTTPTKVSVREGERAPLRRRAGVSVAHPTKGARVRPGKRLGCMETVVCVRPRDDKAGRRYGHGVWVMDTPVTEAFEIQQDYVPACDVADRSPQQPVFGCERYGEPWKPSVPRKVNGDVGDRSADA